MDPNPRKTLRVHVNHLKREIAALEKRKKKFEDEAARLTAMAKNDTIESCRFEAERWKDYQWYAFP